mmetsp:Transcript_46033/g.77413  ORF Transcript_46033/g.77413 Transcript_46033/m.77413 type:complete len:220 (-) Transcript_46033:369-1028(-)
MSGMRLSSIGGAVCAKILFSCSICSLLSVPLLPRRASTSANFLSISSGFHSLSSSSARSLSFLAIPNSSSLSSSSLSSSSSSSPPASSLSNIFSMTLIRSLKSSLPVIFRIFCFRYVSALALSPFLSFLLTSSLAPFFLGLSSSSSSSSSSKLASLRLFSFSSLSFNHRSVWTAAFRKMSGTDSPAAFFSSIMNFFMSCSISSCTDLMSPIFIFCFTEV